MDIKTLKTKTKDFVEQHSDTVNFVAGAAMSFAICTIIYVVDVRGREVTSAYRLTHEDKTMLVLERRNGRFKDMGWNGPTTTID